MKIAIIADAHGNRHGFEAVLEDIRKEEVDRIITAGDMITPFPDSRNVWNRLREEGIPGVLGNNEEFILKFYGDKPDPLIKESVRFMPVQYAARLFTPEDVAEMHSLPLNMTVCGPEGDDVLVCHASPFDVWKSISDPIDSRMASDLARVTPKLIVAAHYHSPWMGRWEDKVLIRTGSCGLPMTRKPEMDYLILEHMGGGWRPRHKSVVYDHRAVLRYVVRNGFLDQTGPMGWLYMADFIFLEPHIVRFFKQVYDAETAESYAGLQEQVVRYLKRAGVYEEMRGMLA